jgi:hypothetical protein|tara:strand:- start:3924 stop:4070 length:147 start_codon:yes stop_codon:yes gene_type:complete
MKLISPDGKCSIEAHPSKIEQLKKMGWKEEAIQSKDELKSSSKKKSKE